MSLFELHKSEYSMYYRNPSTTEQHFKRSTSGKEERRAAERRTSTSLVDYKQVQNEPTQSLRCRLCFLLFTYCTELSTLLVYKWASCAALWVRVGVVIVVFAFVSSRRGRHNVHKGLMKGLSENSICAECAPTTVLYSRNGPSIKDRSSPNQIYRPLSTFL